MYKSKHTGMRVDFEIISDWIEEESRVVDLGCGDGKLLEYLISEKEVCGMGIEIDQEKIIDCATRGISIVHQDLNHGLKNLPEKSFDYAILSQTLQVMHHPIELLNDMLRIANYSIVSFPNFGHFSVGLSLLLKGLMPQSKNLPFEWYDTPNIHLFTIKDFRKYCENNGITIHKEVHTYRNGYSTRRIFANKLSESCVMMLSR